MTELKFFTIKSCFVCAAAVWTAVAVHADDPPESSGLADIPQVEQPFWENAQAFVDAYALRDTASIGELFTEDAEFYDEFGERTISRSAIEELFGDVFEASPESMISEIHLERVRLITDNVALEEGRTTAIASSGATPQTSRYVALHVKEEDGVWRIDTLKSFGEQTDDRQQQLGQLIWLIGDWMSEQSDSVVQTTCRWSDDGNFLLRSFQIQIEGETAMSGVQRIGWDPLRKQLRSWTFDSEGGFFEGLWSRNGNQWIVVSQGVTATGEPASGTAVYTVVDEEMLTWEYRNLLVGNELRENNEPVVMVRRPPSPATEE